MCKAVKIIVRNYLGENGCYFFYIYSLLDNTTNYVTYTALVHTGPETKKSEWF